MLKDSICNYDKTKVNMTFRLKIVNRAELTTGLLMEAGFAQIRAQEIANEYISIHDYLYDEEESPGFHIVPIKLSECVRITIDLELISMMLKKETDND